MFLFSHVTDKTKDTEGLSDLLRVTQQICYIGRFKPRQSDSCNQLIKSRPIKTWRQPKCPSIDERIKKSRQ